MPPPRKTRKRLSKHNVETNPRGVGVSERISLDTKGHCLFCFRKRIKVEKGCPETFLRNPRLDERELQQRFCRLLSRHLAADFSACKITPEVAVEEQEQYRIDFMNRYFKCEPVIDIDTVCQDCFILLENFCQFYLEMKSLEIQVDWQIRKLKNIMAFAERAPTRIKQFREQFNLANMEDKASLSRIETFRKEILVKYTQKFSILQPRIVLKRKSSTNTSNVVVVPVPPRRQTAKKSRKSRHVQTDDVILSVENKHDEMHSVVGVPPGTSKPLPAKRTADNNATVAPPPNVTILETRPLNVVHSPGKNHWNFFCPEIPHTGNGTSEVRANSTWTPPVVELQDDSDHVSLTSGAGGYEMDELGHDVEDGSDVPIITSVFEVDDDVIEVVDLGIDEAKTKIQTQPGISSKSAQNRKLISVNTPSSRTEGSKQSQNAPAVSSKLDNIQTHFKCVDCGKIFPNTSNVEGEFDAHDQICKSSNKGAPKNCHVKLVPRDAHLDEASGNSAGDGNRSNSPDSVVPIEEPTDDCQILEVPTHGQKNNATDPAPKKAIVEKPTAINSKLRPFVCKLCNVSYTQKNHLTRHKKSLSHDIKKQKYKAKLKKREETMKSANPQQNNVKIVKVIYVTKPNPNNVEAKPPDESGNQQQT